MNELYDDERALITRALQSYAAECARVAESARLVGNLPVLSSHTAAYNAALGLSDKLESAANVVLTYAR